MKNININKNIKFLSRRWIQYAAVLTSTLCMFSCGLHFSWTSPSLPKLYANDSTIPTTPNQGSWLASISLIGELGGSPLAAFGADIYGRKWTIIATAVPYFIAWIMIAFATNISTLYVARFMVGMADGSAFTIMPMYIAEIAETDIRGKLGGCITTMADFGILFMFCVGPFISIPAMAGLCSIFPLILIVIFLWMPESPYYLLTKNDTSTAKHCLQTLRGKTNVDEELKQMSDAVEEQMLRSSSWKELLTVKSNVKALLIVIGLKSAQQFSGISAFLVYSELIFEQAESGISASLSAIIFGLFQLVSSVTSSLTVDYLGRKPLLIISCIGAAVSLGAQSVYFYFLEFSDYDMKSMSWFPVTSMIFYVVAYSFGLGVMPFLMPGELFPTNVKAKALCLMDVYLSLAAFVVTKVYQTIADAYGTFVPFGAFMFMCILSALFVVFCVPETRKKSLEEVQDMLKGKQHQPNIEMK